MGFDAAYLRQRAKNLRQLAKAARDTPSAMTLTALAQDFEDEARRLEGDGAS